MGARCVHVDRPPLRLPRGARVCHARRVELRDEVDDVPAAEWKPARGDRQQQWEAGEIRERLAARVGDVQDPVGGVALGHVQHAEEQRVDLLERLGQSRGVAAALGVAWGDEDGPGPDGGVHLADAAARLARSRLAALVLRVLVRVVRALDAPVLGRRERVGRLSG